MNKPPAVRRTRHEKLMDARIAVNKAANKSDLYTTNRLLEGIDYLFFEVDMLIHQVEELKKQRPELAVNAEQIDEGRRRLGKLIQGPHIGMAGSYEEGVLDALAWVVGRGQDPTVSVEPKRKR